MEHYQILITIIPKRQFSKFFVDLIAMSFDKTEIDDASCKAYFAPAIYIYYQ